MSDALLNIENYINELSDIQNDGISIASVEPEAEGYFEVNADTREISIPEQFQSHVAVLFDHKAEIVNFRINRYFDNVDFSEKTCIVLFRLANGEEGYIVPSSIYVSDNEIIISWDITYDVTKYVGSFKFALCFYSINSGIEGDLYYDYRWNSIPSSLNVVDGLPLKTEYSNEVEEANLYEDVISLKSELDNINYILEQRLAGEGI